MIRSLMSSIAVGFFFFVFVLLNNCQSEYLADWRAIDSRPLPRWYDEAKIGIFIHWGIYSVVGVGTEWFWYNWQTGVKEYPGFMKKHYPLTIAYQDFAKDFDASLFKPKEWADLFQKSGAQYVVLTAKHHEGYTLWPSAWSPNWNSEDVGPKRDLVGELAAEIRKQKDLRFGLYNSLMEWFNPMYLEDKKNNWTTSRFVAEKLLPEMTELVNLYKPDVLWADGDWEPPSYSYWNSTEFLAWLYNKSPVKDSVVVNDRWGVGALCKHGDFLTCSDRHNPGNVLPKKWENCFTLDKSSWGYRRDALIEEYLTEWEMIATIVTTVSCGGNALVNIGPRKDGTIEPLMQERLTQLGRWLLVNGEAIYKTSPWLFQRESDNATWYTAKQEKRRVVVYAILIAWPSDDHVYLTQVKPTSKTRVSMLGCESGKNLPYKTINEEKNVGIVVDLSSIRVAHLPSTVTWVLKLTDLSENQQRFHPEAVRNYN